MPTRHHIGYAWEFTGGPSLIEQAKILRRYRCRNIWTDTRGAKKRDGLQMALMDVRGNDVFIVASVLSIAPRATCKKVFESLHERNIPFRAIDFGLDTRLSGLKTFLPDALRQFDIERNFASGLILEGLAVARQEGRVGGRRKVLSDELQAEARRLLAFGILSMQEVAERVGVSRSLLYAAGLTVGSKNKRPPQ